MKHFDDDMDELFNKAGRHYPLKTEPKNWDAVRGALHPEEIAAAARKRNGYRRFLPLLLLLLIPAVYFMIEREEANGSVVEKGKVLNEGAPKENDGQEDNKRDFSLEPKQANERNNLKTGTRNSAEEIIAPGIRENMESNGPAETKIQQDQKALKRSGPAEVLVADKTRRGVSLKTGNANTTNNLSAADLMLSKTNDAVSLKSNNLPKNKFSLKISGYEKPSQPSQHIIMDKPLRQLSENKSGSVPPSNKKKPTDKLGFYYGITAAPDVSTIKGQDVKGTGYSAGIVAGYQVNLHWSVEAGILWSKKKYFTDGKYFSKAGAGIPPTVVVTWLDGSCNMLEFPVLVRYDLSPRKNTFFAAAGLTSYMMKKEDYLYGAWAGMGPTYYEGHRSYDRSGDHLFSNLQLSAGYKFSLLPKMNIRIEPYLKAPLKKIGIGRIPITSAGLSLGITRDFR